MDPVFLPFQCFMMTREVDKLMAVILDRLFIKKKLSHENVSGTVKKLTAFNFFFNSPKCGQRIRKLKI